MERRYSSALVAALFVVAAGGVGSAGFLYIANSQAYSQLDAQYQTLLSEYDELLQNYSILTGDHEDLEQEHNTLTLSYDALVEAYAELGSDYYTLQAKYTAVCEYIRSQILPLQGCTWAEAVRHTHLQEYLDEATDDKSLYVQFAAFCRDLVLHASGQIDLFQDVSGAFAPAMAYGSDTILLCDKAMRLMAHEKDDVWDHFPYRWGWYFYGTGAELYGIDTIVQDCIDSIEYEYDDDITYGQLTPDWDYPKHPVETAFRMMGDCEDQAMLCASYLERDYFLSSSEQVYFQTALAFFHDPDHRNYGEFYHAALLVHIEDTAAFWSSYSGATLWRFGAGDPYYPNYTWCFVDPTWDVPFGSTPSYMDDYLDNGLSFNVFTVAFCDYDGTVM